MREQDTAREGNPINVPETVRERVSVRILGVVEPKQVNAFEEKGEWEEIEMGVDSGAAETVVDEDTAESVRVVEGEASRKGVQYEMADGTLIPNKGEKIILACGETGGLRNIIAQVCAVNKALLSVKRVTAAGTQLCLNKDTGGLRMMSRRKGCG